MTYMAFIYGPLMPAGAAMSPEAAKAMMDYTRATQDAGVYVGGHQLEDPTMTTLVTVRDGKRIVSDGPFVETKEVLGGYYLFKCANLDEALDWAVKCPVALMGGTVEVRPVVEN